METQQGVVTRFEFVAADQSTRTEVDRLLNEADPAWHWSWSRLGTGGFVLSVVIDAELSDDVRDALTSVSATVGERFAAA